MKRILSLTLAFSLATILSARSNDEAGTPYRGWKKGEMDIHHIYTGRGEANFYIFPDGTSMLIDTGDHLASVPMTDPKPDLSRRAGEWVSRYILRTNPSGNKVDYLMVSHFHDDHMGSVTLDAPTTENRTPNYKLIGIAEVGEHIQFKHFIDRGYPDYNYPVPISDAHIKNYRNFAEWHKQKYGAEQVPFEVGALNQIALQKRPKKYASLFSIRNLAANGEVWNGNGTTRYYDLNPKNTAGSGNENTKSIAFRIQYGPFSYFAGGDLSGSVLNAEGSPVNIEEKTGEACGEVDVCKCNHHAYKDAMHPGFLSHVHAQAYVIPVWDQFHTQEGIIKRMLQQEETTGTTLRNAHPTLVLSQYIVAPARQKFAAEEWMQKTCPHDGHIVIKVYDKGRKYKIYRLSAENEDMIIQKVYGPFQSKGQTGL